MASTASRSDAKAGPEHPGRLFPLRKHAGVGRSQKGKIPGDVVIDVDFGENARGANYGIAVAVEVKLPALTREQAITLVEQAHQICPYSNATRGNIDVELSIADVELSVA